MGFDYFVGRLRCAACGRASEPDGSTNIQTKIRDDAGLAFLGVGARVEADARNLGESDYLELRSPGGCDCRILHAWECAFCGSALNWAVIVVRGGEIREVSTVTMNAETLASAHYIWEYDGRVFAARLTGRSIGELNGQALLDVLHGIRK